MGEGALQVFQHAIHEGVDIVRGTTGGTLDRAGKEMDKLLTFHGFKVRRPPLHPKAVWPRNSLQRIDCKGDIATENIFQKS